VKLALDKVNLWPRRENSPHELSGGEKQKLTIADWLVSKPQVLIFDETTAFLDLPTRFELYENIRRLIVDGLSVIWISQEDYEIAFADYIIELLPGYLLRTSSNK
jgi:ABC-type multidrug transport system ATPase subunit